jgi:hypothetical protein
VFESLRAFASRRDRERLPAEGERNPAVVGRQPDTVLNAELQAALEDPDPLRGITQLTARWAAAFLLDPDGVTRIKRSAAAAWHASYATLYPADTEHCAAPCGSRCD